MPDRPTNHLANETSLYLRQHMFNPVNWYPWGAEALEIAQREDRPLLVSIGYSACHWCHVMEHESFEDADTAALMNRLFVCIKVDREERPDVDQIYMDAQIRMHGHGGWPLNLFCTPDGRPFYGGTYFPPEPRHGMPAFRQVVEALARAYQNEREDVEESAQKLLSGLARNTDGIAQQPPGAHLIAEAARNLLESADTRQGGFGNAPKFPTPPNLDLLLASLDELPPDTAEAALEHVLLTCRLMARGGIYDQLGGGFHRYSVDAEWLVPHFEKMLYDQGQLLRTYAEAWRRSGCDDPSLTWPIEETAAFLRREMKGTEGAFYASQDADSEGVEGKFYVWKPEEIGDVLDPERVDAFCQRFDVSPQGNFEGNSILRDIEGGSRQQFGEERHLLWTHREKRTHPATDTKRVTAWNGLTISGLARAGSVLADSSMLADAVAAADFILNEMFDAKGRLLRVFNDGRTHILGFLDDNAAMLECCLDLYRAGAGDRYFVSAIGFAEDLCQRFFDADEADFFLTPVDGDPLVHRPRSNHDGATPDSTGLAVMGLLRIASLTRRADFEETAWAVLRTHAFMLERAPHAFPTLTRAAQLADRRPLVAVVVGDPEAPDTVEMARRARQIMRPDDGIVVASNSADIPGGLDPTWLAGRESIDERATAYVCRDNACSTPITDPEQLTVSNLNID